MTANIVSVSVLKILRQGEGLSADTDITGSKHELTAAESRAHKHKSSWQRSHPERADIRPEMTEL